MNLIIIGASGLVGQEFIKLISEDIHFPENLNIFLVGSSNSKGTIITIKNKSYEMIILDDVHWNQDSIFINCADKEQAKEVVERTNY